MRHRAKGNISNLSECSICNQVFPENKIFLADQLPFCEDHYLIYRNSQWIVVDSAISNEDNSLEAVRLYENKIKLYQQLHIPTVLKTSYKISDSKISTQIDLFARVSDSSKLKKKDPS